MAGKYSSKGDGIVGITYVENKDCGYPHPGCYFEKN